MSSLLDNHWAGEVSRAAQGDLGAYTRRNLTEQQGRDSRGPRGLTRDMQPSSTSML